MILNLGGEAVVVTTAGLVTDPDSSRAVESWAPGDVTTRTVTTTAPLEPRPAVDDSMNNSRNSVISGWTVYLPADDPITPRDRVTVRGRTFRVQGEPARWAGLCVVVQAVDPTAGSNAVVTLRRPSTGVWDDGAEATVTTPGAVYASNVAARITDQVVRSTADPVSAEETLVDSPYLVTIEQDLDPREGDEIDIERCIDDQSLAGRVLHVHRVSRGTDRFERDLFCTLVDTPPSD